MLLEGYTRYSLEPALHFKSGSHKNLIFVSCHIWGGLRAETPESQLNELQQSRLIRHSLNFLGRLHCHAPRHISRRSISHATLSYGVLTK